MRATHLGTCQICGRQHKLPSGVLSKHGYTQQFWIIEELCIGSYGMPFEQSTDLIGDAIARAANRANSAQRMIDELNEPRSDCTAWVHHDFGPLGYRWVKVEINKSLSYRLNEIDREIVGKDEEYTFPLYLWFHEFETPQDLQRLMNKSYINLYLAPVVKRARDYMQWQEIRVAQWRAAPLTPIEI